MIDPAQTQKAIQSALQGAVQEVGINWATTANGGVWEGPVTVRLLSDQEVELRAGIGSPSQTPTYWDLSQDGVTFDGTGTPQQWVYEVTFQGEAHDTSMSLEPSAGKHDLEPACRSTSAVRRCRRPIPCLSSETTGTEGTLQHDASIAMTPDGSYVEVWTQDTTDSVGDFSNQNIYYHIVPGEHEHGRAGSGGVAHARPDANRPHRGRL